MASPGRGGTAPSGQDDDLVAVRFNKLQVVASR